MRKLFLLLALLWGATSYAQVTVTGTVTDANSQAFANGTYQFTFATAAGIPGPYSFNGANFPISTTYSGSLDSSGAFSQAMAPNNQITPSGSQWILRFCPAADAPCYQTQLAITGAGSITSSLTPPAIQVPDNVLNQPKAYADSEITTPVVGFAYFNLTSSALRVCTVSVPCTWANVGAGGTVTSVAQTVPSWFSVAGSPITTSGTLAITAATGQTSHQVIGTCNTATSFAPCSLVAGDLPAGTTQTIANGTSALGTSAIGSGACATVVTTSATGTATTDNIMADFNADPTSTTGYQPSANGMLTIIKYPTSNNVNFKVCNNTSASITPGAVTLNWRVVR